MYFLMRSLLILFASASGYLIVLQIAGYSHLVYAGLVSGLLIAILAILFEKRIRQTPLRIVLGGAVGLILGLTVANLLTYPLMLNYKSEYFVLAVYLITSIIIGYLGLSIGMRKGDEFDWHRTIAIFTEHQKGMHEKQPRAAQKPLVIDTSVIIDGRIAEVCETGFIDGKLVVPQFVLQELQHIADSSDPVKRARGKRGLDVLKQIQSNDRTVVEITEKDFPDIKEVDSKLVALAKDLSGKILTNDANLNKVAELHGVKVLNLNRLATAMKPVVLPGEVMNILVLKEGKEHGQGVGYLEDGTMVVIDNAREHVGKAIDVIITSVLQTTGGRMIFSKVREDIRKAAFQ